MSNDPVIEPDTKNWTWVLERQCPECGFDGATVDEAATADTVRRLGAAWAECLAAGPEVRVREVPTKWSVLEYGCHVRDVFELFDYRLALMLAEDGPRFQNWDQDATAVERRYGEQDPATVANEVREFAEQLAARFDTVGPDDWARTGVRSDGAEFTVESFARYLLHDPIHHLWDVGAAWD